ncbi:hypothetical protein ACFLV2_01535 [Chloroflexota bacterium]
MSMDWVPWVIRTILIVVGMIMVIVISKRKKEGIYQGQYYIGIFVVGITAFTMGVILLIVSSITDLSLFYALYLIVAGVIALLIGLVARRIWKKNS